MDSYDSQGSFYDDDVGSGENNGDDESSVSGDSDFDEDVPAPLDTSSEEGAKAAAAAAAAAAAVAKAAAAAQHHQKEPAPLYCFTLEPTEALLPPCRTHVQKQREHDWFLVVIRDLDSLVSIVEVKPPPATTASSSSSSSSPVSTDAAATASKPEVAATSLSYGTYKMIDGVRCVASDEMQLRLKRNCALLHTAMKSADGNQYFTPKAAELATHSLAPFILSEELMFGCRSSWNTVVTTLKNVLRRTRNPPPKAKKSSSSSSGARQEQQQQSPTAEAKSGVPVGADDGDVGAASTDTTAAAAAAATPTTSTDHHPLDYEAGPFLEWTPMYMLTQKLVSATHVPGASQAYGLMFALLAAMCKMMPSTSLAEIWKFSRRHFVGYATSPFHTRIFSVKILGRSGGAADTASIKEQCETLREMVDWTASLWQVPYPVQSNMEEVFQALSCLILAPVGLRLVDRNREAFDKYVVPLRRRVLDLLGPHFRVILQVRKTQSGRTIAANENSARLMALLIVRGEELGWAELTRWRRVLENACTTKSHAAAPVRYLMDLCSVVNKFTQKRMALLRGTKPLPSSKEVLGEVSPALEGEPLQRWLSLTVPLVAGLAFNTRMFESYSHTMWLLAYMDPTPATAARILASVQVGLSESGKETKQVTQALKILSDQLCGILSQSAYTVATTGWKATGRKWPELLMSNNNSADAAASSSSASPPWPTHCPPGDLHQATIQIGSDCHLPSDCAKKTMAAFFDSALENLESTVEDRVNDALRCIYALTIFGQCDTLPPEDRRAMLNSLLTRLNDKYYPIEARLSADTAGILHFAFSSVFRLVSDDIPETLRIIKHVRELVACPSIHETWSTAVRTFIASILEQGAVRFYVESQKLHESQNNQQLQEQSSPASSSPIKDNSDAAVATATPSSSSASSPVTPQYTPTGGYSCTSDGNCEPAAAAATAAGGVRVAVQRDINNHPELREWFVPLIDEIFHAAETELANDLTTTSRFVGNIYMVCTVLEHLPSSILRQFAVTRVRSFIKALITWCTERAADPDLTEKREADMRCAASSIQSIYDVALRALTRSTPIDPVMVTLGSGNIWQNDKDPEAYLETSFEDFKCARELVEEALTQGAEMLRAIKKDAPPLERALRCCLVGRVIGGSRSGCWTLSALNREAIEALDVEIANMKKMASGGGDSSSSSSYSPSHTSEWWTARYYDVEVAPKELLYSMKGVNGADRDVTDVDTEVYTWLLQEILQDYCFTYCNTRCDEADANSTSKDDDASASTANNSSSSNKQQQQNSNSKKQPIVTSAPPNTFDETHPLCTLVPGCDVDDIPAPHYKTIMSLLEGNYTFDYTGLLNDISAGGDDGGRELYHFRMGAARSVLRNKGKAGAFARSSSTWSSRYEAAVMLNLSFSKSVAMRQQSQAILVGFCNMWCSSMVQSQLVEDIVQALKTRLCMDKQGWLAALPDVICKAVLYLIPDLIGVLGRDHAFQLADPLLTELCLGGQLPRPSNERRKESKISYIVGKLTSTTYGPPQDVCDAQIGRWLTLAQERNAAPVCVARCLRVALCYFRLSKRISPECPTIVDMRHDCLNHVTQDHIQFLLSLVTQLHRATENAWKVLHNIALVISRSMHFVHTHLPRKDLSEAECCPNVMGHKEHQDSSEKEKNEEHPPREWTPLDISTGAVTDCCPLYSAYLYPGASCSVLHRAQYTWGKLHGHTAEIANTLGTAFLRPEFIRQCLDVHIALLRSEAIATERAGRGKRNPAASVLAGAIEWSRFCRCAVWAQLSNAAAASSAASPALQEISALHEVSTMWCSAILDVLPAFGDDAAQGKTPTRSPAMGATAVLKSPAFGLNGQLHVAPLESLDPLPAAVAAGPSVTPRTTPLLGIPLKKIIPAAGGGGGGGDAANATEKQHGQSSLPASSSSSSQQAPSASSAIAVTDDDAAAKQQPTTAVEKEKTPQPSAKQTATSEEHHQDAAQQAPSAQATATTAAATTTAEQDADQQQVDAASKAHHVDPMAAPNAVTQTSAVSEFLAGAALLRGLFPMFQHTAYSAECPDKEKVLETRTAMFNEILAFFRSSLFVSVIPHESAALFITAWGQFAGAMNLKEKEKIHEYLFAILTMAPGYPEALNELVRRRAWSALRKSYGNPAKGMWREVLLIEDSVMMHKLLTPEVLRTAIDDPSRSVRSEANMSLRVLFEACVVSRVDSFVRWEGLLKEAASTQFKVADFLVRSDVLSVELQQKIMQARLEEMTKGGGGGPADNNNNNNTSSPSSSPSATSASSSSSPNRVRAAIACLGLVTSGVAMKELIRYIPQIASTLISVPSEASLAGHLVNMRRAPYDFASISSILIECCKTLDEEIKTCRANPDNVVIGQVIAKLSPLIVYIQYLGVSRFACDISGLNVLDVLANCFTIPGRALFEKAATAVALWSSVLPRADVRAFVIRQIKALDAAAPVRDTVTMKTSVASLAAVCNAFPEHVPAFVPACLMKLVKYRNVQHVRRDEDNNGNDDAAPPASSSSSSPDEKKAPSSSSAEDAAADGNGGGGGASRTVATSASTSGGEDYKSVAAEGLQKWWASHLEAWDQTHKACFTEAQAQAISDACKARSYFV